MNANKIAIIVPFYRDALTRYETIALEQCETVLSAYQKIAIKPRSLNISTITSKYHFDKVISFDDEYFRDIQGYNKLMLSAIFYQSFLSYQYILIHQLDAFVFTDDLLYWCNKNIDYIGAPWLRIHGYTDIFKAVKSRVQRLYHARLNIYKNGLPSDMQFINKVGNGGFSLRRVNKFYDLCSRFKSEIELYNTRNEHYFNEDVFWSIEVNRKQKNLRIPGYRTGLRFAFEHAPHKAFKINSNKLPFGCHAWDKNLDFWRPVFSKYNIVI